ncbi:hypothetical protein ACH4C6_34250 [Streptomyces sp. NPDC017943]|uniref:hypothetical protein n=1 Tax=Streptomyces sp. NPDC017943 TaxID=3365019 RepID=UPI0037B85413
MYLLPTWCYCLSNLKIPVSSCPRQGETSGLAGALTTAEREELVRLRRKVHEQEATIEVLGKATAFFAQQKTK